MGNTTNGQKKRHGKLRWDGSTMVNKFELAKIPKKADISKYIFFPKGENKHKTLRRNL